MFSLVTCFDSYCPATEGARSSSAPMMQSCCAWARCGGRGGGRKFRRGQHSKGGIFQPPKQARAGGCLFREVASRYGLILLIVIKKYNKTAARSLVIWIQDLNPKKQNQKTKLLKKPPDARRAALARSSRTLRTGKWEEVQCLSVFIYIYILLNFLQIYEHENT